MASLPEPLDPSERRIDAYWRAANYLSVGQIYLLDNPLLDEPLRLEQVKPRLLGHWGTTPGLNLIYAHLNRVIKAHDLDAMYVIGPGHGGPGIVANAWLEGTYSEVYPGIGQDREGIRKLFRQFSFPGGIPSHVAPETPGSIHEGGELGYSLVARLRGRLRQPRPAGRLRRRRRRGGDRPAGGQLALEQVPRPGPRRRRPADPAPERLQDRQPDRAGPHPRARARLAPGGLRLPALVRRGRRAAQGPPAAGRGARRGGGGDPPHPALGTDRRRPRRAPVADDRAADPQGLDRPEGGRRAARRGHLAGPPGAASPTSGTTRAPGHPRAAGCAATGRRSSSTSRGRLRPELARLAPPGGSGG